jgi:glucose-6-phosphate isomerase
MSKPKGPKSSAATPRASVKPAYTQDIAACLAAAIGAHGLAPSKLDAWLGRLDAGFAHRQRQAADGELPIFRIASAREDVEAARDALATLSKGAKTLVFFGTGGSSLGGQTLAQLAGWNIPGGASAEQRQRPRTRFYDNLDGATLERALAGLDLETTRFIVTSKSGGTVETLVQTVATLQAVKKAGLSKRIPELFLGVTEPAFPNKPNSLRELFESFEIPMLPHHTGIGGRFSVLSVVGLLPAMARGLDPFAIRAGAAEVLDALAAAKQPKDFAPAIGAAVAAGLAKEHGVKVHVMMPYADRLGRFGDWFAQLWAESLGKNGKGTSPVACLGPLDQHSQLQLFQDGPHEHLITLLRTPTESQGPRLDPALAEKAGIGFLGGKTPGDLVAAQAAAVADALRKAGRPVRVIDVPHLDERSIGALFMHFMLETIFVADLSKVDPFDQPAVELAKQLARARLTAKP